MARSDPKVDVADLELAIAVIRGRWRPAILALRQLERDGMVARRVEATAPPRLKDAMNEHARTLCTEWNAHEIRLASRLR